MKSYPFKIFFWITCLFLSSFVYAQDSIQKKKITIDELFSLVTENNPSLAVSKAGINIAKQDIKVAKNQRLPDFNANVSVTYIGDVSVLDENFSNFSKVDMPHFGNVYAIEATQLIWRGNAVNNAIQAKSLHENIASLSYLSNEQNIKLLALGYYLDLYKLQNQASVYRKNIELAEKRLKNSNQFFKQGMVTRNDVIRGELQISNLNLSLQVIENNIQILNKQLTVALGLPEETQIIAEETILNENPEISLLETYQNNIQDHPILMMTKKAVELYEVSEKITKAERMPVLSAFARNTLQRPITTISPALDMYSNGWNVGLSLSYNISSLYKTPKKIQLNKYETERAQAQANEAEQLISVAVKAAYIKYNESVTQNKTFEKNKDLANENYRIMESKYNNQLAILLDLIDASNTKLDAELQYTNSEINLIFAYYKLVKESGKL
ncbi:MULTISPECIES: TolC family protein [unclassified Flavobacterium]|uniref:TolC family protein n=1 Tax=unclassified Flavobacterium TaxID=196869 RepID=UPI000EB14D38|nr:MULTISPECIES: TolC family protein [unclassified Flavobacterium]RKS03004.1 outer membrane protein TolC [Flavobacterium sp. 102]